MTDDGNVRYRSGSKRPLRLLVAPNEKLANRDGMDGVRRRMVDDEVACGTAGMTWHY
jgi:hypothetical protein